jgi:pimeloyl-ACP methyl ester carboxylesterase
MLRLIMAVIAGLVAGFVTVFVAESVGHQIYPPPPGADASSMEGIKRLIAEAPLGSLVAVLVAWGLGTFAAAAVALLAAQRRRIAGWIAAGLLACASAATLVMIPHPMWFVVAAALTALAAAWLADRLLAAKTA